MNKKRKSIFVILITGFLMFLSNSYSYYTDLDMDLQDSFYIYNNNILDSLGNFKGIYLDNKVYSIVELQQEFEKKKKELIDNDLLSKNNIIYIYSLLKKIDINKSKEYIKTLIIFIKKQNEYYKQLKEIISFSKGITKKGEENINKENYQQLSNKINNYISIKREYDYYKNQVNNYRLLSIDRNILREFIKKDKLSFRKEEYLTIRYKDIKLYSKIINSFKKNMGVEKNIDKLSFSFYHLNYILSSDTKITKDTRDINIIIIFIGDRQYKLLYN